MRDYILSPHYNENKVPVSSIPRSIEPKLNILGRTHEAPTVGSYNHFEGMLPLVYRKPSGEIVARHITTSNRWEVPTSDFASYHNFSPQLDDLGFGTWKSAGEKNQAREYVKLPQKSALNGLIESFSERKLKHPVSDTSAELYVHDTWYSGRINDFGRYSHLVKNLKQHLMEYYGLKSSQELASFLESRGSSLEDIGYLAIGFIPGIYGIGRANDGQAIFFAGEDSHENVAKEARHYGLDIKKVRAIGFDEEQTHNARRSYDKGQTLSAVISEEIATKRMLQEFYLGQAKAAQGNPDLVREYLSKAAIMEGDIQTTRPRYTKAWRKHWQDLEEIVDNSDEHANNAEGNNSHSYQTANGKVVHMPAKNGNRDKRDSGEKGEVVYGRFGKYQNRNERDGEKTAPKSESRDDAPESGATEGEAAEAA